MMLSPLISSLFFLKATCLNIFELGAFCQDVPDRIAASSVCLFGIYHAEVYA